MKKMFKEDHSLERRCEGSKIRVKYPGWVPGIVEKISGSQIVDFDKRKYLVPSDITVAQLMWTIRKRIQLPSEKAIVLFVDRTVPQSSLTMGQLYEKEKEDGFLYVACWARLNDNSVSFNWFTNNLSANHGTSEISKLYTVCRRTGEMAQWAKCLYESKDKNLSLDPEHPHKKPVQWVVPQHWA
ncbi:gamma-aminobutyric acid receptor-associated protein-like 2 [Apodemus sylvaticus]|uniref:gamma-aminobutyric acid receptor-associated protein-like 2 n=1 Tax=Apodemus sylvaticus TaxID=10129 RepID=UPI002243A8C7|nr:gamma-aminobutyric acid receptor-associated protein-like 2 [Apodemus sylvaticus]